MHRDGRTINRRLTMLTISQRGSYSMHTQSTILHLWVMFPTAHHPSLHPSKSSSLDISNMTSSAFRRKMLRKQRRPIPHRNGIVYHWKRRCLVAQYIQRKVARESDSSHVYFVEECLQHNANFKVAQRCQYGIPHAVLMILKAFLRRECGRGNGTIHSALGNDESS